MIVRFVMVIQIQWVDSNIGGVDFGVVSSALDFLFAVAWQWTMIFTQIVTGSVATNLAGFHAGEHRRPFCAIF